MPSGFPQIQGEHITADAALDRALKKSSLTFDGRPFHSVLNIGTPVHLIPAASRFGG